jgi:hypothetical protein
MLPAGPEYLVLPFAVRCIIKLKMYRNTNLPLVVHGCETGSLILREGYYYYFSFIYII